MIRLFVNLYSDPDPVRDAELRTCLARNRDDGFIDHLIGVPGRPTFQQFFDLANQSCGKDDVAIIANSDIYFDDSIRLSEIMDPGEAFALSRWEDLPGSRGLLDRCDSQDAWIFRGPIKNVSADFTAGIRGCDNRLAAELHKAGYRVSNPSRAIRAFHLHRSGVRHYGHAPADAVPPPYLLIDPAELGASPTLRFVH